MKSNRLARRIAAAVGGTAIVAMIGLTAACGSEEEKAPETTTTTTTPSSRSVGVTHREVDQPHGWQPVHASGQGASGADGHSWRQLTWRGLGSHNAAA